MLLNRLEKIIFENFVFVFNCCIFCGGCAHIQSRAHFSQWEMYHKRCLIENKLDCTTIG